MKLLPSIWVDTVVTSQQIHPQKFEGGFFFSKNPEETLFSPLLLMKFPLLVKNTNVCKLLG